MVLKCKIMRNPAKLNFVTFHGLLLNDVRATQSKQTHLL
jgi:hypothetical protein